MKTTGIKAVDDDSGNKKSGYYEKNVNSDKSSFAYGKQIEVKYQDKKDCNCAKPVDIWPILHEGKSALFNIGMQLGSTYQFVFLDEPKGQVSASFTCSTL